MLKFSPYVTSRMGFQKGSYFENVSHIFGRRKIRDCSPWEDEQEAKAEHSMENAPTDVVQS